MFKKVSCLSEAVEHKACCGDFDEFHSPRKNERLRQHVFTDQDGGIPDVGWQTAISKISRHIFEEADRDSGSALFLCYPAPSPASELKLLASAIPIPLSSSFTFPLI